MQMIFKRAAFYAQIPFIRWKEAVGVCKVACINRMNTSKELNGKIGFSFSTVSSEQTKEISKSTEVTETVPQARSTIST